MLVLGAGHSLSFQVLFYGYTPYSVDRILFVKTLGFCPNVAQSTDSPDSPDSSNLDAPLLEGYLMAGDSPLDYFRSWTKDVRWIFQPHIRPLSLIACSLQAGSAGCCLWVLMVAVNGGWQVSSSPTVTARDSQNQPNLVVQIILNPEGC